MEEGRGKRAEGREKREEGRGERAERREMRGGEERRGKMGRGKREKISVSRLVGWLVG